MDESETAIEAVACRFGLSLDAGRVLFAALRRGGGRQAQFSHAELGGMGQWSGGMTQIGDMFNAALKARVAGFCETMAPMAARRDDESTATASGQRPGAPSSFTVAEPDWAVPIEQLTVVDRQA